MTLRATIASGGAVLASLTAIVLALGCASAPVDPPKDAPRFIVTADGGEPISSAELDELTRAFADRYVGLLYSACDALKKDNPDAAQRHEAQTLLVDCATNIYDIATNADAFTRLLDLAVVTSLVSRVWVGDGRAVETFGDRAAPLTSALLHGEAETRALAARVLTVEQVAVLDSLIADWRRESPDMVRASFVRFSNFAIGRGRSAASEVLAASGFLARVGQAGQAVDEARLLGERMFYQFKRTPTLLRWQAAAAKDEIVATPEVTAALADLDRLTEQVERLPAHVAAEREALLAAIDSRLTGADATIAGARELVDQTQSLIASLEPAAGAIDRLVKSADGLFARYEAWDRWTDEVRPRPFDVREYTEIVREAAITAQRLNDILTSSGELLASPDWKMRMDDWNRSADGRIDVAAGQGRRLMDEFFLRLYIALGVLLALLVCYRVLSILLVRGLGTRAAGAHRTRTGRADI